MAGKGIYHSELEQLTNQHGGAWISLEKSPKAGSKNKDIYGFVSVTDWNGTTGRYINIENENVYNALSAAPVGVPVQVRAGGKGADAWLQVVQVQGGQAPPPGPGPAAPPPTTPAPSGPPAAMTSPPPQQQQQNAPVPSNGNGNTPSVARVQWECLKLAAEQIGQLQKDYPADLEGLTADAWLDAVLRTATTMSIRYNDANGRIPLSKGGHPQD